MFVDRQHAGRELGAGLAHLAGADPVVLGLPRGGVIVGAEVAEALGAPLDVLVVRKLGAPHQPELAIGAVTCGSQPHTVLNRDILETLQVGEAYLDEQIKEQLGEVRRRQDLYRRGQPGLCIAGRTTIVVDDGIATGASVRAGLAALRAMSPRRLVLAVPVGPPSTIARFRHEVDEVVCLHCPPRFTAVGAYYDDFPQTTDAEVIAALAPAPKSQKLKKSKSQNPERGRGPLDGLG